VTGTLRSLLALGEAPRSRVALTVALGSATIVFGVGLMGTAGYLISRAAERPAILSLTAAIVGVRFFGIARPIARYFDRLTSPFGSSPAFAVASTTGSSRSRPPSSRATGAETCCRGSSPTSTRSRTSTSEASGRLSSRSSQERFPSLLPRRSCRRQASSSGSAC